MSKLTALGYHVHVKTAIEEQQTRLWSMVNMVRTLEHLDVVARGKARGPRNPEFLLHPDELPKLVAPLTVQEHFKGTVVDEVGERSIARIMAVKH